MATKNTIASGAPSTPPSDETAVTPSLATEAAAYERIPIKALKDSLNEIKVDVRDVKDHRLTDFIWHAGALIAFGTFVIALYFWIDDKVSALATASARVDTKLEDLLARIPPAPTPPQK
jgi:hypothetical protein